MNYCFITREFKVKPAGFTVFSDIIGDMSVNRIFKYKWTDCIVLPVFLCRKINSEVSSGFWYCSLPAAKLEAHQD